MSAVDELLALDRAARRDWIATDATDEDLSAIFAMARADHGTPFILWRDDPIGFCEDVLGDYLTAKQGEILESSCVNRKTVVPASHAVGKTVTASRRLAHHIATAPPGTVKAISCYTDDTEVLTRDGWKLFADVTVGPDGDLFATRNPETKAFEWQHAFRYHSERWDGEVVDFRGQSLDLRVTPNHRMLHWVDQRNSGEILKRADEFGRRGLRAPATSTWTADTPETVRWGRHEWDAVDFAAFLGAWMAEGSLGPPYRSLLTRMLGREPDHSSGKDFHFNCADLYRYLMQFGKAADKHVPEDVKNWGTDALRAFLTYYLLGDGWQTANGQWRSCTVSKRLADDLQEIAQKLGMHASIRERKPRDGGTFADGRTILAENRRTAYYVNFNVSHSKAAYPSRSHYDGIVYCVSVPNEVLYVRRKGEPIWCGNTAPTHRQVRNVLWPHVHATHRLGDLPGRLNQIEWVIDEQVVAYGFSPSAHDESAVQGIHATGSLLIIIDEAGGIPVQLGRNLDSITTGDTYELAIGNPPTDAEGSWFESIAHSPLWHSIHISAFDSPNFCPACQGPVYAHGKPCVQCGAQTQACPPEIARNLVDARWVADVVHDYGLDDPFYIARVLAEFPRTSSRRAVPRQWVEQVLLDAHEDDPSMADSAWQRLGVDVAAGGGDEMVVAVANGWRVGIPAGGVWSGTESIDQVVNAERVVDFIRAAEARQAALGYTAHPVRVKIDSGGIGGGTADILDRMGRDGLHSADIVRVNSAEQATDHGKFTNCRAEMWWTFRELCRDRTVRLQITDREVKQITVPTYTDHTHGGRILIESKQQMKARGHSSPDRADAIILSVYEPVSIGVTRSYASQMRGRTLPKRIGSAVRKGL